MTNDILVELVSYIRPNLPTLYSVRRACWLALFANSSYFHVVQIAEAVAMLDMVRFGRSWPN